MRAFLVLLHRYIGLATALFLLMAGLTGSILAFNHELDEWLNPEFYTASSEGQRGRAQQPSRRSRRVLRRSGCLA